MSGSPTRVTDGAIQVFGGAGLSGDTPLALFYAIARQLRIVDGPDEVHLRSVARHELSRPAPARSRDERHQARPAATSAAICG